VENTDDLTPGRVIPITVVPVELTSTHGKDEKYDEEEGEDRAQELVGFLSHGGISSYG
jgi:hypothetical protein